MKSRLSLLMAGLLVLAFAVQASAQGVVWLKPTASVAAEKSWSWNINKTLDTDTLLLSKDQSYTMGYTVTVNATSSAKWTVSGDFVAANKGTANVTVSAVLVTLSTGQSTPATCAPALPRTLTPNALLGCSFSISASGAIPTGYSMTAYDGSTVVGGGTDSLPAATITGETDECATITDVFDAADPVVLGQVCATDGTKTFTFHYTRTIGPYADCATTDTICNFASYETNDTKATAATPLRCVNVTVAPCASGCSLTPGYWKTHSEHGPAPYDSTWASLDARGADKLFFISGQTWYQVLWTAPRGGSAYYILAHAYIATRLNILNGAATTPEVNASLAWATAFFSANQPSTTLSRTVRNLAVQHAGVLDSYNNGLTGPGHCSEEPQP